MTDKERLEEIDIKVDDLLNDRVELLNLVNDYYLQAERVQELEEQKLALIEEMGQVDERFLESEHQNKKLREALEFYATRDNYKLEHFDPNLNDYMSTVDYDEGEIARKALEEVQ